MLPIGRGLPDIDIFGLDNLGENVIAQITQSKNYKKVKEKSEKLIEYDSSGTRLYFFGPASCKFESPIIQYISIENVFDTLAYNKVEMIYPLLLKRMLKWEKAG